MPDTPDRPRVLDALIQAYGVGPGQGRDPNLRTCPACGGRNRVGYVLVEGRLQAVRCPTCDGTGRITVEHYDRYLDGRRIRTARQYRGEGLRECARRLGVSAATLSAWETGDEAAPAGTVEKIREGGHA